MTAICPFMKKYRTVKRKKNRGAYKNRNQPIFYLQKSHGNLCRAKMCNQYKLILILSTLPLLARPPTRYNLTNTVRLRVPTGTSPLV